MSTLAATQRNARKQLAAARDRSGVATTAVTVALLLGAAIVAAAIFAVAAGLVAGHALYLEPLDAWLSEQSFRRLGVAAGSLGVGIVALSLLVRRPGNANGSEVSARHVVEMGERGVVFVNSHSVSALASAAVRRTPGTLSAEVRVKGTGSGPVRLFVRAAVMPGASLPEVGRAAQDAARDAAVRLAGLQVQDVNVELVVALPDDIDRMLE